MNSNISEISIHLKDGKERNNEISLLEPLKERRAVKRRRSRRRLSWVGRVAKRVRRLFARKLSPEERFKSVLAHLLTQQNVRDHFMESEERRAAFFKALREAAHQVGYTEFSIPSHALSPDEVQKHLTTLEKRISIQQMGNEGHRVLDAILSKIERLPITSCLEVLQDEKLSSIDITTQYAKFHVLDISPEGKVNYKLFKNRAAPATSRTSTINQKVVLDTSNPDDPTWIGTYSGELSHVHNLLEQILLIMQAKPDEQISLIDGKEGPTIHFLFTSLYGWRDLEEICMQRDAIRKLNGKTLYIGKQPIHLRLFYHNLNSFHRIPIPAETRAFLEDINDESMIPLLHLALGDDSPLAPIVEELDKLPLIQIQDPKTRFLERQKKLLACIDDYRAKRKEIAACCDNPLIKTLLLKQRPDGRALKGLDALLYLDAFTHELHIFHNKNCRNAADRTSGAKAADKAQNGIRKLMGEPFLPGFNDHQALFKVLYSLYLLWEEPEINSALTTGTHGAPFFKRFFHHNPDHTNYLMDWAKGYLT
ncbi:MAG: hypothetical protein H7A36_07010 [Chlamydiales bacterium]|nr:hypothetical protein [Chlamydiales bacterium]